jgi:hypothetical protein
MYEVLGLSCSTMTTKTTKNPTQTKQKTFFEWEFLLIQLEIHMQRRMMEG